MRVCLVRVWTLSPGCYRASHRILAAVARGWESREGACMVQNSAKILVILLQCGNQWHREISMKYRQTSILAISQYKY